MTKNIIVFLILALTVGCQETITYERPRDPWVFRSVLDERPRMITMALNENLWAAYDVQKCGLYKAWKGNVIFDGAVYTTRHGPQPQSMGDGFILDALASSPWTLVDNGQEKGISLNYQGHRFQNNQVTLGYRLQNGDQVIEIHETPEYSEQKGNPGLSRTFLVEGLMEGQTLALKTTLGALPSPSGYKTNGDFTVSTTDEQVYGGQKTYLVNGILTINNGKTFLETSYKLLSAAPKKEASDDQSQDQLAAGAALIENSDCKTCHNETQRTVGPSYLEVAERYPTSEGSVRELTAKVIEGGTGAWGEVPMTAHPDLQQADASRMIRYILSLDKEEGQTQGPDLMLGQPTIPMKLGEENQNAAAAQGGQGLATSVYIFDDHGVDIEELIKTSRPILSGTSPAVHLADRADFGKINTNILIEFKGQIHVEKDKNVDFRLVSDDGSLLYVNGKRIIDNGGFHGTQARDGELILKSGANDIRVIYYQGESEGLLSLQWAPHGSTEFQVIPADQFTFDNSQLKEAVPYVPRELLVRSIPGDQSKLQGVHPSFDLAQARPQEFQGRIGGMDFLTDGRLVVCTWDSLGPVYVLKGVSGNDPEAIEVERIATGLAEPLGLKVVDNEIYVLQKQELTKLIDHDGDGIIDEYRTVCDDWKVSANFHEFAFGLEYQDGYFYASLATAINPGGASTQPQIEDRGKVIKISKEYGSLEFLAHGLRTPNGIGKGVDNQLFIADNQGDWLPSSKIVHVQPHVWYGSRSVDFQGTAGLTETLPLVWLPQDEIGNSPSQPILMNIGPYKNQMIHGEVTHGGIKRVFVEKINGQYQGAVFRFTQGLEAGVNRLCWGPDGALYVGEVGSAGNWSDGHSWYGLQRLSYNENPAFEMLAIRARSNGVELEFTEPIEKGSGQSASEYLVKQWYYLPTEDYGGPKLDLQTLEIKSVNLSEDRKKVFLELPAMRAGHVVHVRIYEPFRSVEKRSLWSTEGWYTMNNIPQNLPGFKNPVGAPRYNTLSEEEKAEGWELLFDGTSTRGWRNFKSSTPGSAWKASGGSLMLDNSRKQNSSIQGGGDIITEGQYQDFELVLEWKIEEGGNSGVIYNVVESDAYEYIWQTGPEMQVLDNVNHADGRIETHRAGDLYDMIACKFVAANGAQQWNRSRIVSKNGKVSHWLNGYELVNFEMHNAAWDEMVAKSKFKDMPDFGKAKGGHIALQDHGDRVWFRNIKIKKL